MREVRLTRRASKSNPSSSPRSRDRVNSLSIVWAPFKASIRKSGGNEGVPGPTRARLLVKFFVFRSCLIAVESRGAVQTKGNEYDKVGLAGNQPQVLLTRPLIHSY